MLKDRSTMIRRPTPPLLQRRALLGLFLLVTAAAWLTASVAGAQTITIQETQIERDTGFRSTDELPNAISYSDCTADDEFHFPGAWEGNVNGLSLEVWAGSNCTTVENRNTNGQCWQVYAADAPDERTFTVSIRTRDIVAQNKPGTGSEGPGSGTIDDCEWEGSSQPQSITLFFMFITGGTGESVGTAYTYPMQFDLLGPPAPTDVEAGIGEERLVLDWDQPEDSDVRGYAIYCDPAPGAVSTMQGLAGGMGMAGQGGMAGGASGAGGTGSGGLAGAGGAGGAGGSGGVAGGTGGTGGSTAADCGGGALVEGERPAAAYRCGTVSGRSSSGTAKNLVNGREYAVAVAATDTVGNVGPLSEIVCGTPEEVDDFFEVYRRAGGEGGGGFCSINARSSHGALALLGAAFAAYVVRRRRRR